MSELRNDVITMSQVRPRPVAQKSAVMSAKDEARYMRTFRGRACWGCGVQDETIVPCHLNSVGMGHGMGIKTRGAAFPGCSTCHKIIDRVGEYSQPRWAEIRNHIVYRVAQMALMELARREI